MNEKKEFRFSVTSKHIKQWKILGWDPLPEGIKLEPPEMEKTKEGIVYKFKGTLGPGIPPGPAGGTIRLRTDFKGHVIEVSVAAEVKRPYKVTPRGFLGFGRVVRSRGKERIIKIVNQEKDKALKILSVRLVGLNKPRKYVKVWVEEKDPGITFEIHVKVVPRAPKGVIRGKIEINLSSTQSPRTVILFSAYIR